MPDNLTKPGLDETAPSPIETKILVVEDDPAIAQVLRLNLQADGYSVVVANDGLSAILEFEKQCPDLVTLDLNVPNMTGYRLIQLMKKPSARQLAPAVVVITALDFEEAEDVVKSGADDFLSKPFKRAELMQTIDFALARRAEMGRRTPQPQAAGDDSA